MHTGNLRRSSLVIFSEDIASWVTESEEDDKRKEPTACSATTLRWEGA